MIAVSCIVSDDALRTNKKSMSNNLLGGAVGRWGAGALNKTDTRAELRFVSAAERVKKKNGRRKIWAAINVSFC